MLTNIVLESQVIFNSRVATQKDKNMLSTIQKSRGELITLSKVLIYIANDGEKLSENESSVVNTIPKDVINECQSLLKRFVENLVVINSQILQSQNKETFEQSFKEYELLVEKNVSLIEESQKTAEAEMNFFLQDNGILPKDKDTVALKPTESLEKRITKFDKIAKELFWTLGMKSKSTDFAIYTNKTPPFYNWKITSSTPVPVDKFFLM